MSTNDDSKSFPRSIRHRQILDVAEENPDASVAELASRVSSATPELVERVFDEYGDPAAEDETSIHSEARMTSTNESTRRSDDPDTETVSTDSHSGMDDPDEETPNSDEDADTEAGSERYPSLDNLSETQRELVEVVAAHPGATQQEIADHFDVTRATISRWANNIEGFEWRERESFVEAVVEAPPSVELTREDGSTTETTSTDASQTDSANQPSPGDDGSPTETTAPIETELKRLNDRVTALEESRDDGTTSSDSAFNDPELVHKIVHACMESETIDESEELRILQELME